MYDGMYVVYSLPSQADRKPEFKHGNAGGGVYAGVGTDRLLSGTVGLEAFLYRQRE